jgi:hypothetical protein
MAWVLQAVERSEQRAPWLCLNFEPSSLCYIMSDIRSRQAMCATMLKQPL